ncbi:Uncharacterized protein HZ326_25249 [Fusarium oxysporum f. sp. albedinis]|nr:Uncharacterized protein HZ326_25249 [Fusarium oxysporum f. sp. albedinis]
MELAHPDPVMPTSLYPLLDTLQLFYDEDLDGNWYLTKGTGLIIEISRIETIKLFLVKEESINIKIMH